MKSSTQLLLAFILALTTSQAFSAIRLAATSPGNFTFSADNTALPLDSSGATSLTFKTNKANQRVAIAYNAECSFESKTVQGWIGVDIIVDGTIVAPSNSDDAMCSSDGGNVHNWTRPVMNVFYVVPVAGTHTIEVKARIGFGTGTGWMSDSSLLIWL